MAWPNCSSNDRHILHTIIGRNVDV